ncbi:MAG: hypothetical protein OZ928_08145, partial [Polyangiaceae bacterium]|nr:hypothetical protein [Polyangiaceae bacterium]
MLNSAVGAAFPGVAAHVQAQQQAAWKRVMARYREDDGHDDVGDASRFLEEMRARPRPMKFCFRFFPPGAGNSEQKMVERARTTHPEAFVGMGYARPASQGDFLAMPTELEAVAAHARIRSTNRVPDVTATPAYLSRDEARQPRDVVRPGQGVEAQRV